MPGEMKTEISRLRQGGESNTLRNRLAQQAMEDKVKCGSIPDVLNMPSLFTIDEHENGSNGCDVPPNGQDERYSETDERNSKRHDAHYGCNRVALTHIVTSAGPPNLVLRFNVSPAPGVSMTPTGSSPWGLGFTCSRLISLFFLVCLRFSLILGELLAFVNLATSWRITLWFRRHNGGRRKRQQVTSCRRACRPEGAAAPRLSRGARLSQVAVRILESWPVERYPPPGEWRSRPTGAVSLLPSSWELWLSVFSPRGRGRSFVTGLDGEASSAYTSTAGRRGFALRGLRDSGRGCGSSSS
jgi:hypothetical protein